MSDTRHTPREKCDHGGQWDEHINSCEHNLNGFVMRDAYNKALSGL